MTADGATRGRLARILVADDDLDGRELLYRVLRHYGEIIEAANGRHALDLIENERFDVVVLDALMPAVTGIEVFRMLRTMPQTASLPVIFISELSERDEQLQGISIPPDDYIEKPIDIDRLQARVEAYLVR